MKAILRLTGRSAVALLIAACVLLIAVQYFHVLRHAVTLANELSGTQRDIADLRALRARQVNEIRRLSDPRGAVPEIHERLGLAANNETFIYLEGAPTPLPSPLP